MLGNPNQLLWVSTRLPIYSFEYPLAPFIHFEHIGAPNKNHGDVATTSRFTGLHSREAEHCAYRCILGYYDRENGDPDIYSSVVGMG